MIDIAQFHPQLVHFVVALGVAGVILRLVSLTGKAAWTNPAATTLLLVAAATSILAVKSGAEAHGPAERVPGAREAVQEHEELGERTRNLFLLVAALELAAIAFKQRPELATRASASRRASAASRRRWSCTRRARRAGSSSIPLPVALASGAAIPADVQRLLVAGLYHQARAARAAGNHVESARLIDELALQRPGDPSIPFLQAEAMIRDRQDFSGALRPPCGPESRLRQQQAQHPEGHALQRGLRFPGAARLRPRHAQGPGREIPQEPRHRGGRRETPMTARGGWECAPTRPPAYPPTPTAYPPYPPYPPSVHLAGPQARPPK